MKKIVFVEKEDGSTYDPVSNFFAKKSQSAVKPKQPAKNTVMNSQQKINNIPGRNLMPTVSNKNTALKIPPKSPNFESVAQFAEAPQTRIGSKNTGKQEKMVTGKIGRKGEHLAPQRESVRKEENIYKMPQKSNPGQSNSNMNSNQQITTGNRVQNTEQKMSLQSEVAEKNCDEMIQNCDMQSLISPPKKSTNVIEPQHPSQKHSHQISALKNRIKELESAQNEYLRRLHEFEQKEQKWYKSEQKLMRLEKEHKLCSSETRQLSRKVQEKEDEIKKLLRKDDIPYNKKRQVMLANQICQLKKRNRELTARIKNYKGTDLVEISVQNNKADVLKEYDHGQQEQTQMNYLKIQGLLHTLIAKIDQYTVSKIQGANSTEDKKLLLDLQELSKQTNLQVIAAEGDYKMPTSNEQCGEINIYQEIEEFKHRLEPLINKYDLNFVISEHNIQLINSIQEESCELVSMKESTLGDSALANQSSPFTKPTQKNRKLHSQAHRFKTMLDAYEKNGNYQQIIIAHCLAQIAYLKQFVNKELVGFKDSIKNSIHVKLKELEQLCEVGPSAKQSLFMYLSQNVHEMMEVLPNIELRMKEIGQIFGKRTRNKK